MNLTSGPGGAAEPEFAPRGRGLGAGHAPGNFPGKNHHGTRSAASS